MASRYVGPLGSALGAAVSCRLSYHWLRPTVLMSMLMSNHHTLHTSLIALLISCAGCSAESARGSDPAASVVGSEGPTAPPGMLAPVGAAPSETPNEAAMPVAAMPAPAGEATETTPAAEVPANQAAPYPEMAVPGEAASMAAQPAPAPETPAGNGAAPEPIAPAPEIPAPELPAPTPEAPAGETPEPIAPAPEVPIPQVPAPEAMPPAPVEMTPGFVAFPEIQSQPDETPIPTLLAERGALMYEDDCSEGGRRGLGIWSLSSEEPGACHVKHNVNRQPEHIPIASYPLPDHQDLVVQVTFRWGEPMGGKFDDQLLAVVSDLRPTNVSGHRVEAWATGTGRFTHRGIALTSSMGNGKVMDEQEFDTFQANTWYTAVYELVGDEVLFRVGGRTSYAKDPIVVGRKNKITLFFGTTWHEVKSVRMWHATPNPEWDNTKEELLSTRGPFTSGCEARHSGYPCK